MNSNMYWIAAFLLILGGIMLIIRWLPTKEDSDIVDDISGDRTADDEIDVPSDVVNVPGHLFLYFSPKTRYVYGVSFVGNAKVFNMYISNNHLCKYLGNKIVEVENNEVVAIVYNDTLPN